MRAVAKMCNGTSGIGLSKLTHELWMDVVLRIERNMQSSRRVLPEWIDGEIQNLSTLNRKFDRSDCSCVCICVISRISLSWTS